MNNRRMYWLMAMLACTVSTAAALADEQSQPKPDTLMNILQDELAYSMDKLATEDGTKPYYLAYTVYHVESRTAVASLGALTGENESDVRNLNIDVRVGDYELDNTHQIRGRGSFGARGPGNVLIPLTDDEQAIRHILWYQTDKKFRDAVERLQAVKTNLIVKVEEEDKSNDFSKENPSIHFEEQSPFDFDLSRWREMTRNVSAIAREYPLIYSSNVTAASGRETRYMVSSEGTRLRTSGTRCRVTVTASTKAEDGMDLQLSDDFNAATVAGLPDQSTIESAFRKVIEKVLALREAPLVEPYIGPAILKNRASGVFFHEIFGHRIEGHRQKDVTEGQTFTRKIGKEVLPEFISVYDDPTMPRFGDVDLRGYYAYDDEGVSAQRVELVDNGVLKTFLLSRSPVEGFPNSNGHGRRSPGFGVVSRQANLLVESDKQVPYDKLREMLIAECEKQNKPFGFVFEDISGGFTTTSRFGPQSFKVLPLVVYRVYVDGRPDELVRGVDIVGTPLSCFEQIIATADDPDVFNGSCGAESGWVPVSAISPSILVGTIEIEKRQRDQSRPPILDAPIAGLPETDGP